MTIMSQGGAIDNGETPKEAAIREAREEAGINIQVEQLKEIVLSNNLKFCNFYAYTENGKFPTATGPDSKHADEILNVLKILDEETIKINTINTRVAWVPVNALLNNNEDVTDTPFKQILRNALKQINDN